MSEPLALLPLALAAAGGRLDGCDTASLVAAGLTLLQRSAPLVRALASQRSAILLPASPAFLVALAASDGRGALLLDPDADPGDIARQVRNAGVGAVFMVHALGAKRPASVPVVWLDDAPRSARIEVGDVSRTVDLGSHFGLSLEGDLAVSGREEECLVAFDGHAAAATVFTHRTLLERARHAAGEGQRTPVHQTIWRSLGGGVDQVVAECFAPLLAGEEVVTSGDDRRS